MLKLIDGTCTTGYNIYILYRSY